jgi:GH43 family beta-xylosidase
MPNNFEGKPVTYLNPVYPLSFPDPFVLKFRGEYFAYCTGNAPDGNVFGILRSHDLVSWSEVGSAMQPLDTQPPYYWAPEVNYDNGKFYLYYSAGNEILMEIRVAIADRPEGPFVDAGVRLTNEEFAIDAHVFVDDDGTRYLFYATDFLEYAQIGTGTVVDRMIDWKTLDGHPRPVTRAKYDWQVYDPARKEKGGVRWYTVEGPTVLRRKGKYFEMFSGGNWQNKSYGVSFAVTDDLGKDEEWTQFSDGEKILPILRTIPEKVIGPGHNSAVRGPNNRELYCVYHRWTEAGRVLAIDRMDFAGDRIFVAGPTTTPQVAPFQPQRPDPKSAEKTGHWTFSNNAVVSSADGECTISIPVDGGSFLAEATIKIAAWSSNSRAGVRLKDGTASYEFAIYPERRRLGYNSKKGIKLSDNFDPSCHHLLRIEVNGETCRFTLDTPDQTISSKLKNAVNSVEFFAIDAAFELSAIDLTYGFEERFEVEGSVPSQFEIDGGKARVADGRMLLRSTKEGQVSAVFDAPYPSFEIAANLTGADDGYGLFFLNNEEEVMAYLTIYGDERRLIFFSNGETKTIHLPSAFEGSEFRQFQLVFMSGLIIASLEGIELAKLPSPPAIFRAAVYAETEVVAEMVRLTAI